MLMSITENNDRANGTRNEIQATAPHRNVESELGYLYPDAFRHGDTNSHSTQWQSSYLVTCSGPE